MSVVRIRWCVKGSEWIHASVCVCTCERVSGGMYREKDWNRDRVRDQREVGKE